MAAQYYLMYSVSLGGQGEQVSSLTLYSDENGTPESTGTKLLERTGVNGVNLKANLVNNRYQANKTGWTDTFASAGGEEIEVEVRNAGTPNAVIRVPYNSETLVFDAGEFELVPSAESPAFYTFNGSETPLCAPVSAKSYAASLTGAESTDAVSIEVSGSADTAADRAVLKYGTDPALTSSREITLPNTGTPFPVTVTGLTPSTTYYFKLVLTGPLGTAESAVVSAATPAPAQLDAPEIQISDTDYDSVKKVTIANVENAAFFDIEYDLSGGFDSEPKTARVANRGGAEFYARDLEPGETVYFRVKSAAGDPRYADSDWSQTEEAEIGEGEDIPAETAELRFRSNIYLDAEPTHEKHAVTVGKVHELLSEAVSGIGSVVHSIAGYSGTVTAAQFLAGAASESKLIAHGSQNINNIPQITENASDDQLATAKAIYHFVRNAETSLNQRLSAHSHTYLYAADGESVLASPNLDGEAAIVPDTALGSYFDADRVYQPGELVAEDGFLYQNTSGETARGNADFQYKFEKKSVAELLAESETGGNGTRYETAFTGADLNESFEMDVTHGLGRRFVFVEVIETTDGTNYPVTAVQVNLTGENTLKLTFSGSVKPSDSFRVIARV